MVNEDYVSFEIAKLLKEKGFNWNTDKQFNLDKIVGDYNITDRSRYPERYLDAPTLQMAMKWLRETFEIHCQIDCPIAASNWVYGIRDLNKDEWVTLRNMGDYETYEEACEAGIRYVLENLI